VPLGKAGEYPVRSIGSRGIRRRTVAKPTVAKILPIASDHERPWFPKRTVRASYYETGLFPSGSILDVEPVDSWQGSTKPTNDTVSITVPVDTDRPRHPRGREAPVSSRSERRTLRHSMPPDREKNVALPSRLSSDRR
jgi:hypothetical protein